MISDKFLLLFIYISLPSFFFLLNRKRKVSWGQRVFIALLLFLIVGLRGSEIGSDTGPYSVSFESGSFAFTTSYEITWIGICSFVKYVLHKDFQWVLLIYSAFTICPVVYVVSRQSKYPLFSLFLYVLFGYYFLAFNIIRQSVAMSFSLLAVYFWIKRHYPLSVVMMITAFLFHRVAIVVPILLWGASWLGGKNKQKLKIMVLLSLAVGPYLFGLINKVTAVAFIEKFTVYAEYAGEKGANVGGLFIQNLIGSLFCLWFIDRSRHRDFYSKAYFSSIILGNLFLYNMGVNRIIYFLSIFSILAIPNILYDYKMWRLYRKRLLGEIEGQPVSVNIRASFFQSRFGPNLFLSAFLGAYSLLYIYSIFTNASGVYPFHLL